MEIQQLTYFLAAAQTQNLRRAAELCFVAQSALSRQIASLEEELDIELFRREKKRVALTEAGREFALYVKSALDELQAGKQSMNKLQSGQRGTIHIGCVESLAAAFLPPLFASFRQQYPHVRMKVRVDHTDELMAMVEQGNVELGLILDPATHSELLILKELFRQPLQLLVPAQHPLVQANAAVPLSRIKDEPLLLLDKTSRLGQVTGRIFAQRGLAVRPVIEIESIEGLKELVRQGVGVTLTLPALVRSSRSDNDLVLLPIDDVKEEFIFALIYPRSGSISQAARAFINAISMQSL